MQFAHGNVRRMSIFIGLVMWLPRVTGPTAGGMANL